MEADLRRLRYFLALADELHFGMAARRERITQQTLSRAIAQLEREVGRPLFVRSTRSVELTRAGEAMIEPARRAVAAAAEAVEAARHGTMTDPVLRVDVSSSGIATGAQILRVLEATFPQIAVHQVEIGVERGLDLIRQDRLDVVLGLAPDPVDGAEAELVRREPVLVGLAASHPWASRTAVPVGDLAGTPLLLPAVEVAAEWRDFVTAFCRAAGFAPTPFRHVTHGSVAAADALRTGGCVTPTMAWTAPPPDLVFLPLTDPAPVFPWSAMWRTGADRHAPVLAFRRAWRLAGERSGWLR